MLLPAGARRPPPGWAAKTLPLPVATFEFRA